MSEQSMATCVRAYYSCFENHIKGAQPHVMELVKVLCLFVCLFTVVLTPHAHGSYFSEMDRIMYAISYSLMEEDRPSVVSLYSLILTE